MAGQGRFWSRRDTAWSFCLGLKAASAAGTRGKVSGRPARPGWRDMAGPMRMDEAGRSAGRRHRAGDLIRHRDFRLLWLGETVSQVGTAMAAVAVPLLAVTVLHASTFMVSMLVAAAWLPWLLIGLPAGAWVDRLPCRAVMVTCDAVSAALYASVPVAAWLGVLTIPSCWPSRCSAEPPASSSAPPTRSTCHRSSLLTSWSRATRSWLAAPRPPASADLVWQAWSPRR